MSDDKGFKLKLTGQGMNLEREVSAEVAQRIVSIVLGGFVPTTIDLGGSHLLQKPPFGASEPPPTSIREFLTAHSAERIPDQIATIGLFLKQHSNLTVFTKRDFIKAFEDAQEPVPKNLSRDIAWAVKIGWIAPKSGQKNSYYLTGSGEAAVLSKFPEDVKKKTKVDVGARKRHKARTKKPTT